jgi:hypothetical protein
MYELLRDHTAKVIGLEMRRTCNTEHGHQSRYFYLFVYINIDPIDPYTVRLRPGCQVTLYLEKTSLDSERKDFYI